MRAVATVVLLVLLAVTATIAHAWQDGAPVRQPPRIPVELSKMLLHSPLEPCARSAAAPARVPAPMRIATWNIQAARTAPVESLAALLRELNTDVVALQEVDVRTRRSGFIDQPTALATTLGLHYVFAGSIEWDEGDYGLAFLSRWPLVRIERHRLDNSTGGEPRIVLDVTVCANGQPLRLLNHHADRRVASRASGFAELRDLVRTAVAQGVLVLGDLNELSDGPGVRSLLDAGLVDLGAADNLKTTEFGRIDFILADGPLAARMSAPRVWTTDKSDHHALLTTLDW